MLFEGAVLSICIIFVLTKLSVMLQSDGNLQSCMPISYLQRSLTRQSIERWTSTVAPWSGLFSFTIRYRSGVVIPLQTQSCALYIKHSVLQGSPSRPVVVAAPDALQQSVLWEQLPGLTSCSADVSFGQRAELYPLNIFFSVLKGMGFQRLQINLPES